MGNTLYASFADPSMAERAAGALLDHGVRANDISIVQHEGTVTRPLTDTTVYQSGDITTNTAVTERADIPPTYVPLTPTEPGATPIAIDRIEDPEDVESAAKYGISTTTGADAGAGAIKGTAWGAGIGAIAALASLMIPGVGLVIGGGALATAIGGLVATTASGAVAGAVTGYLKDQGVEEHAAIHYENTIAGGGALLAVTLPSGSVDETSARMVLDKYGAANIQAYVSQGYLA